MNFIQLLTKLVAELNGRIRNGQLTERGLAKRAFLSQPHVHHILSGKRGITAKVADRFLHALGIRLPDLLRSETAEIAGYDSDEHPGAVVLVPLLGGALGPGEPAPSAKLLATFLPLPAALLPAKHDLIAVRLGDDSVLYPAFEAGDLVVIARGLKPFGEAETNKAVTVLDDGTRWILRISVNGWWKERIGNKGRIAELIARERWSGQTVGTVVFLVRGLKPVRFPIESVGIQPPMET